MPNLSSLVNATNVTGFRYERILEGKRQFNTPTKLGIKSETIQADLPLRG